MSVEVRVGSGLSGRRSRKPSILSVTIVGLVAIVGAVFQILPAAWPGKPGSAFWHVEASLNLSACGNDQVSEACRQTANLNASQKPTGAAESRPGARENTAKQASASRAYAVQLFAGDTEEQARAQFVSLQAQFKKLLADASPVIQVVALPDGPKFRLRLAGAMSAREALGFCDQLIAAGLKDCWAAPN